MKRPIMAIASAIVILGTAGSLADGRPGVVLGFLAVFVGVGAALALIMMGLDRRLSGARPAQPHRKRAGRNDRCGICAARLEPVGSLHVCRACDGVPSQAGRPY